MKSNRSRISIVIISLFVAALHFMIGPDYSGPFPEFVRGYLIDILLPANVYLLLQLSLRKKYPLNASRISGGIITFFIGLIVEIFQFFGYDFLGSTFDPVDILMYLTGVLLGLIIDLFLISRFENKAL